MTYMLYIYHVTTSNNNKEKGFQVALIFLTTKVIFLITSIKCNAYVAMEMVPPYYAHPFNFLWLIQFLSHHITLHTREREREM